MSKYCPNCHSDFTDSFDKCVYCGSTLLYGNNPKPKHYETVDSREIEYNIRLSNSKNNTPHCPTCGSSNIHKISTLNKVGSVVTFGILATGHVSKTFKCSNCGMKF